MVRLSHKICIIICKNRTAHAEAMDSKQVDINKFQDTSQNLLYSEFHRNDLLIAPLLSAGGCVTKGF